MFRKSTWLILCLCGLLVLLLGCKKAPETMQPVKTDAKPTPSNNINSEVPRQSNEDATLIPDATATDPNAGPPRDSTMPMTARQAADRKVRDGASMDEMEILEVPK